MAGDLRQLGGFVGPGADPTTVNESSQYAVGDLGKIVGVSNTTLIGSTSAMTTKYFQKVQLDSGSGATCGQVLIWKDYVSYKVTTVGSTTSRNNVAGLNATGTISGGTITSNATAGNFIWIQIAGLAVGLFEAGQTPAAGDMVIAGATTAGSFGITAQGTAPLVEHLGTVLATKTTTFAGSGTLPSNYCAFYMYGPRFIV
jgi:hypothetical protein